VKSGTRSSFALDGKPLPFVPYIGFEEEIAGFRIGRDVQMRRFQDLGRAVHPEAAVKARIEVEKFRGPLLERRRAGTRISGNDGVPEANAARRK
jgi:hypothetical protein